VDTSRVGDMRDAAAPRQDGLGSASLVFGIAGLLPLAPPVLTSVVALVLGYRSVPDSSGARTSSARTGILLGWLGLALSATFVTVYFGILGYPLPRIHRYHPS
jgi:uncharacterized BrkB/YihY/UPF0761 family membrane protein